MKNSIVLVLALAIAGCAVLPTTEQQIQMQEPADTPEQILDRAATAFTSAPGLTAEQKTQLSKIYTRVYIDAAFIRRDMGKTKSLMFSTLAKADYKSAEINNLKSRIINLDKQRLNLMFQALEDVQKVIGKGPATEKIYERLRDYEGPARFRENAIE